MAYIDLDFEDALQEKFNAGRRKYRSNGSGFIGDPLEELFCEMLDAYHYTVQLEQSGVELPGMRTTFRNIAMMLQERRRELTRRI